MKKALPISILLLSSLAMFASKTYVSTAREISSRIWEASDTVVMKNGAWVDQVIKFRARGTSEHPALLIAEEPGSVILKGDSRLELSGDFGTVSGLLFKEGSPSRKSVVEFMKDASNCRVTNTKIDSYNPDDVKRDYKWVSINGKQNRVDHCSFINKYHMGTLMVVWLDTAVVSPSHVIDHNHFGYRRSVLDEKGKELNGQEIIRVGNSGTSMVTANCLVENNYFERCDGEVECISNKSCGNTYRGNLFFEVSGGLTLRHGNSCLVEKNTFIGNGKPRTAGIRVIGENHTVKNNYLENITGNGFYSAICVMRGKIDPPLYDYFQVKNLTLTGNVLINCKEALNVSFHNSRPEYILPPVNTRISCNLIYNTDKNNIGIAIGKRFKEMDITWTDNYLNEGQLIDFSSKDVTWIKGNLPEAFPIGKCENSGKPLKPRAISSDQVGVNWK